MSFFSTDKITKTYQSTPVIEDVSVTLKRGEIVCLLGESGIGKTTLFQIMSGLDRPDTGAVFLDEKEITGIPGQVSYMLQKDLLMPFKTIVDNVAMPLRIKGEKWSVARSRAGAYLEDFGLLGYERHYPNQLSGGMRQRAALLRTILNQKEVILLDEPFSALDSITKMEMHLWFLDLFSKLNISAFFITHDIDEAIFLSDRIYIMAGHPGRITQELSVAEERPRGADFYTSEAFIKIKKQIVAYLREKS
ncbi:MAG: ABC transporter ATP-binding protein [Clostridia bacterium]